MKTNTMIAYSLLWTTLLTAAGSALGQTPTCVAPGCNSVASDTYFNTASGSQTLTQVNGASGGTGNTASGYYALYSNTTGSYNTASGDYALGGDTAGYNTAIGFAALNANSGGVANTASGYGALNQNTTGYFNTASGSQALVANLSGTENTASGAQALYSNTTGSRNNASGQGALYSNTTASDNNAVGTNALHDNTTGTLNNAVGGFAMEFNTTGSNNNAVGYGALLHNTAGADNSAQGYFALANTTTGNLNIGIGYQAGLNQTSGSQNIYIGNPGVAAESNVIRIGSKSAPSIKNTTYIAGISGNVVTGGTVVVTASGQLGVASSSRRYKQDIEPLGNLSERLYGLRAVKFRYIKPDEQGRKPLQFGLIAEEVAAVLPELVYRDAEGRVEGVRYDELTPILLNELQQQRRKLEKQADQLRDVQQELARMRDLSRAMQAALAGLQAQEARVAMR